MKDVYMQDVDRGYVPDTSNQATSSEEAQLQLVPLHIADPVMDPALRTEVITLRGTAAHAKVKYYPKSKYDHGALGVIDQVEYAQMTLNLHILPDT